MGMLRNTSTIYIKYVYIYQVRPYLIIKAVEILLVPVAKVTRVLYQNKKHFSHTVVLNKSLFAKFH
jgi:hypothetical protein